MPKFITAALLVFFWGCQSDPCVPLPEGSPWEGTCRAVIDDDTGPPPRLIAVENHLEDPAGREVVLRGVSFADPFFLADDRLTNHFCEADVAELATRWNVNIIRVPIHPGLWQRDGQYMEKYLDPIVGWGEKYGVYILIDWHAHGNPVTGETEHPGGENTYPWQGNPYNPDLELAITALSALAGRYGDEPGVLYECFNEPVFITWELWRPIAEELVDTIQARAPEALVLVSGTDWGYELSGALTDPVVRHNVIYSMHAYPGKGNGWMDVVRRLKETVPVMIGEWGYREGSCNPNLDATADGYALPLLAFAAEMNIGWLTWVWHPFWEPPLLASWDYQPTEFGTVVMGALGGR